MAALTHNPSRRALLGAAVALPFSFSSFETGPPPDQVRGRSLLRMRALEETAAPPPRPGEDLKWERALRAFERAEATLRECERRTSGAPWEEQDAVEEEYGACLDVLYGALRRLLRVPAPDLAALAVKIELIVDHEVATLTGGEACLAALRRDARRLCSERTPRA
jgi:hypothetical protein